MTRVILLFVLFAVACNRHQAPIPSPAPVVPTSRGPIKIQQTAIEGELRGISGLAPAGDGTFWVVPERDHRLFRVSLSEHDSRIVSVLPIRGAPVGQDLESVGVLTGDTQTATIAFGTETMEERTADRVIVARLADGAVTASGASWSLDYAPWSMTPESNRGLEALCVAGDRLLVIAETVKVHDGVRLAPLAIRGLEGGGPWRRHSLVLESKEGKVSAVTCRRTPDDGVEAVAIERHFGVMRLLRFVIPTAEPTGGPLAKPIAPTLIVDLADAYGATIPPNFEGIGWVDDRTLLLVSDNDYGSVSGPTLLLKVQLPLILEDSTPPMAE